MAEKKMWKQLNLTCKPLDNLEEILSFLQEPPSWGSLCTDIKPHSINMVRNNDVNKFFGENLLETPQTFCHYDRESEEEVERIDRKKIPKTLVCHDMANGYHDDSVIDGTGDYSAYTFSNWGVIDIFCYFSHHFITIPPLGWINVGHAHGTQVIGTVITEWAEGVALWDKILQSESDWQHFASALVAIAKTLRFDGWLLNIENKIAKPNELLKFVRYLHTILHEELENPVLIWYDSVTVEGHLNWQNGLNGKNKAFFDIVDGFFTNYSWSEKDVEASVTAAGERLNDLYIGIDVWGRNFYGGGQFNTQEAVQVAFKHGCSLAIFAPAWTHEAMSENNADINSVANSEDLDMFERFLLRDRALWGSLWPYLNTKLPSELPFKTSFCRGQGKKRRLYGEAICPVPWFNLRHMQYQPNSNHGPHGYLLSTQDNIAHLSRFGLLSNKAGILRYRRSLEVSRELAPGKSKEVSLTLKEDSITVLTPKETVVVANEINEGRTSVKRKMKNAFLNLFKSKAAKSDQFANIGAAKNEKMAESERAVQSEQEPKTDEAAKVDEQSLADVDTKSTYEISGRSMVQMSVNIRLGDRTGKTRYALAYVPTELECLEPFFEDSFLGGSCLKINPSDEVSNEHWLSRLFFCDFHCHNSLIACVVTKNLVGHEDQFLNMKLNVVDAKDGYKKVVLVGRSVPHGYEAASAAEVINLYPLSDPADPQFRELQKYVVLNEPDFYMPIANAYGWKVRYYEIQLPGARVTSINCQTGLDEGPILLGHFGLCARTMSQADLQVLT
ncbi:unnamed protein product [Euphydryas editha]|uniref:Cytosolic endo-beta-N-acetylglucosaminidase TIM barrel domain-containing protein n=1 Tax=Euphydryas editha TaxID=104508 RepID=A0AAU9VAR6_EUPED|nr:unnamed protein product [Euphydryas editha]